MFRGRLSSDSASTSSSARGRRRGPDHLHACGIDLKSARSAIRPERMKHAAGVGGEAHVVAAVAPPGHGREETELPTGGTTEVRRYRPRIAGLERPRRLGRNARLRKEGAPAIQRGRKVLMVFRPVLRSAGVEPRDGDHALSIYGNRGLILIAGCTGLAHELRFTPRDALIARVTHEHPRVPGDDLVPGVVEAIAKPITPVVDGEHGKRLKSRLRGIVRMG